eukprot:TRINITY_DN73168_c0_g1_i1.p1 TRINITY_DN73168_c0_g1~~TRINITY_DN73168_c0_g1_i1.p1  ORF type:complete len:682 (-),score=120.55 TRINITY_DN73168_c0_g1_i1:99-2144(-)
MTSSSSFTMLLVLACLATRHAHGKRVDATSMVIREDVDGSSAAKRCECSNDPCSHLEEGCSQPIEAHDEAEELCQKFPVQVEDHAWVPFVSAATNCAPRWCCKQIASVDAHKNSKRLSSMMQQMQDWLPGVASDLVNDADAVLSRADPLLSDENAELANATKQSLALIQKGVAGAVQNALDEIVTCSRSELDSVRSGCGNIYVFALQTRNMANKLFGVLKEYNKLLNLIILGARDPYGSVADLFKAAIFRGRKLVARTGAAVAATSSWPATALIRFRDFCWRRRMMISVAGIVIIHGAAIGGIIVQAMSATTVSQGIMPVFESIVSQLIHKVLCPLAANSIVVGFFIQWVIEMVLHSEIANELLENALLPFTGLYEGFRYIKQRLKGEKWSPITKSFTEALASLNGNPWAGVLYAGLYSQVSALFRVGTVLTCTVLNGVSQGLQAGANGGERVVNAAATVTGSLWNRATSYVKGSLGGSTHNFGRALDRQKLAELGNGIPFFHEWLEELHRLLMNLMTGMGVVMQAGLGTLRSLNEQLESNAHSEALMKLLRDSVAKLDGSVVASSLSFVIGGGAAGTYIASRYLPPNPKDVEITPRAMHTYFESENENVDLAVQEAAVLRPEIRKSGDRSNAWVPWKGTKKSMRRTYNAVCAFEAQWQGQKAPKPSKDLPSEDRVTDVRP